LHSSFILLFADYNCDESVWQIDCMRLLGIDSVCQHLRDADCGEFITSLMNMFIRTKQHKKKNSTKKQFNDIALGKTTMVNSSKGYLPTLRNF